MPVRSITLFALGGVANVEQESADAKSEFWMAVAGPAASVVIGLLFLGLAGAVGWHPFAAPREPLSAGLLWLGYINLFLALFNIIPGFPMDGGRILRAIVWSITGDMVRATRIAAHTGQFIAGGFIVFGFLRFFAGAGIGGLWIAFIGWFLMEAAGSTITQVEMARTLAGVNVRDLMSRDCPVVDGNLNLRTFAEENLLPTGRRCFVVQQSGRMAGLITATELKNTPRDRWPFMKVEQVMRSFDRIRGASAEMSVEEAIELMQRQELQILPVFAQGQLAGVLNRDRVMEFLQTQAELRAA
jgi:CBS domain-containing protein